MRHYGYKTAAFDGVNRLGYFTDKIAAMFEGDYRIVHYLAPPITAERRWPTCICLAVFGEL